VVKNPPILFAAMKDLLKLIALSAVLFLLPLVLLSALAGWIATLFMDIRWSVASFIAFLFMQLAMATLDVIGEGRAGFRWARDWLRSKTKPPKQPAAQPNDDL
jgi:hypothetical protein